MNSVYELSREDLAEVNQLIDSIKSELYEHGELGKQIAEAMDGFLEVVPKLDGDEADEQPAASA